AVLVDPQSAGCPGCPRDLASVAADPGLGLVLQTWAARLTRVACLLAAAALAVSRRHRDRDLKAPGLVTVLLVAAESVYVLREGVGSQAGVVVHALLGGALLAVAVSWWLPAFRARRALRDVVRATVGWGDGDEPADVETTLRAALADPPLRVAYLIDRQWFAARGTPPAL